MLDQLPQDRYSAEDLVRDIALLELSDIFDAADYRARAGLGDDSNAAEHHLLKGWRLGLEPNGGFDGAFFYPYFRRSVSAVRRRLPIWGFVRPAGRPTPRKAKPRPRRL